MSKSACAVTLGPTSLHLPQESDQRDPSAMESMSMALAAAAGAVAVASLALVAPLALLPTASKEISRPSGANGKAAFRPTSTVTSSKL